MSYSSKPATKFVPPPLYSVVDDLASNREAVEIIPFKDSKLKTPSYYKSSSGKSIAPSAAAPFDVSTTKRTVRKRTIR